MYSEFGMTQQKQIQAHQHKITQSYNPVVPDAPRPRNPNENPKDYMLSAYTQLVHVMDLTATSSIYRLDPFAKYLCCWSNQISNEELNAIVERTKWRHPNLVSFLFIKDTSDKFSQFKELKIFYEYLPLDVKQLIEKRKSTSEYVPEEELWKMISGLVDAMSFLQKRGISHSALTLEAIYFDEEYLYYRVQDVSPFRAKAPHMFVNQFQPPEQQSKSTRFKQDVFCLGMIILSLATLNDCSDLYNQEILQLEQLIKRLELLNNLYNGKVGQIIKFMVELDNEKRMDWQELNQLIQQQNNQIQLQIKQQQQQQQQQQQNQTPLQNLNENLTNRQLQINDKKELKLEQENRENRENRENMNENKKIESVDQKLINLNKRIQETLSKSLSKNIR